MDPSWEPLIPPRPRSVGAMATEEQFPHAESPAKGLRSLLSQDPLVTAPRLLGAVFSHETPAGRVSVRVTELEVYLGERDSAAPDPGSHAFRGSTTRNLPMYGPPGMLYVYFTYGLHHCANIACGPEGQAAAVLLRAGEVVTGHHLARSRRLAARTDRDLARGPARLAQALALTTEDSGKDALSGRYSLELAPPSDISVHSGPRTGVSGPGGSGAYPWRFWIAAEPTVSAYRAAKDRTRSERGGTAR